VARLAIRQRLTLAFVVGLAVILTGLSSFVYVRTSNNLLEAIDAGLRSRAEVLAADVRAHGTALPRVQPTLLESDEDVAQVTDGSGRLLVSSRIVASAPLIPGPDIGALRHASMFDERVPPIDNVTRVLAVPVSASGRHYVVLVGASLQDRRDQVLQLGATLTVAGAALLVLAGLGAWWLVGAALRPVERLRRQAATISAADPAARLTESTGNDEIARLGRTLNGMLGRIDDAVARERRLVDRASHEMRTPLAVQRTDLELALAGPQTVEELAAAILSASDENAHLTRLADDLLVLSRSRDGRLPIHRREIALHSLLAEAVRRNEARASAKRARLTSTSEDVVARLDPVWIRQALDDLVDNALRATADGGTITVSGRLEDDRVVIAVEDSGGGFSPSFLPHAFEPFTRDAGHDELSGAGLGLAIVRAIAEGHDGMAVAENIEGGARVAMIVPDPRAGADVAASRPVARA
jgi:two-component system OmpR family sensor kinase